MLAERRLIRVPEKPQDARYDSQDNDSDDGKTAPAGQP